MKVVKRKYLEQAEQVQLILFCMVQLLYTFNHAVVW